MTHNSTHLALIAALCLLAAQVWDGGHTHSPGGWANANAPAATQPTETRAIAPLPTTEPTTVPLTGRNEASGDRTRLSDDEVGQSLQRGVDSLLSQFANGELKPQPGANENLQAGLDALCVYSLLQTGQALKDPRLDPKNPQMKLMIDRLKCFPMEINPQRMFEPVVYARSLRASALGVYDRPEDHKALSADVLWLMNQEVAGAYGYGGAWTTEVGSTPPNAAAKPNTPSGIPSGKGTVSHQRTAAADDPTKRVTPPTTLLEPGSVTIRFTPQKYPNWGPGSGGGGSLSAKPAPRKPGTPPQQPPPIYGHSNAPPLTVDPPPAFVVPPATTQPAGNYSPFGDPPAVKVQAIAPAPQIPGVPRPVINLPPPPVETSVPFPWDNSNSQYGLLGVWSGAEAGVEVPDKYWEDVEGHWLNSELKSAQWGYRAGDRDGSLAMNCGGVASLLVTHDYITAPRLHGALGREIFPKPLAAALDWLGQSDNSVNVGGPHSHYIGYELFGVERVAHACGFKRFGTHDWYRELGRMCVASQWPDGAWGRTEAGRDSIIDTAYVLMFLASGRHPILINKLQFDGNWSNRPRDIANLARFASRELERPVNWQVVNLENGWQDWMDCPVLYVASHKPPTLREQDYANLKQYVEAGGLLFTHSDGDSAAFNKWVAEQLVPKVCPGYALQPLPENDPVYSLNYPIRGGHVKLQGVSNGSRLLLVHSPGDLASAWQQRSDKTFRDNFRLGVNLFCYAAGKADLRNRLITPLLPDPPAATQPPTKIVRLSYAGQWNPEPYAWTRFARTWQTATRSAMEVKTTDIAALTTGDGAFCHLTGVAQQDFTDADAQAIHAYVDAGGTLLIDACGGSPAFLDSANKLLAKAFPGVALADVPAEHPLNKNLGNAAAPGPRLRPAYVGKMKSPPLRILASGRGVVILSTVDLSTGLLNTNTYNVCGYSPESCQKIAENAIAWAKRPATK